MTPRRRLDPDEQIPGQKPLWDELDAAVRGEVRPHGTVPMPRAMPPVLPDSRDWGPTFLYRAYRRCGVLAYVGITNNLLSRIGGHAAFWIGGHAAFPPSCRWVSRVARWDWEIYPTRHAAETAERAGDPHRAPRAQPGPRRQARTHPPLPLPRTDHPGSSPRGQPEGHRVSTPDQRPTDELGGAYRHVVRLLDTTDDEALEVLYALILPLPDGRVAAVGDWTISDLAAVRARVTAQLRC